MKLNHFHLSIHIVIIMYEGSTQYKSTASIHAQPTTIMFSHYTVTGGMDADIVTHVKTATDECMRWHMLSGILREWQSSSEARQAIGRSECIPMNHTFNNGLQLINVELERSDLKDLLSLFQREKRICVAEGKASKEEIETGLAELKVVYRLLKQAVKQVI